MHVKRWAWLLKIQVTVLYKFTNILVRRAISTDVAWFVYVSVTICWAHWWLVSHEKNGWTDPDPFVEQTAVVSRNHVLGGAHWRHMANTIERSVRGADAGFCQVTWDTCLLLFINLKSQRFSSAGWSIKPDIHTFVSNFAKCQPIFMILSPADSLVNLQKNKYPTAPYKCRFTTLWNIDIRKWR